MRAVIEAVLALAQNPPFTVSAGRPNSRAQSVTSTQPARRPPDEWPET